MTIESDLSFYDNRSPDPSTHVACPENAEQTNALVISRGYGLSWETGTATALLSPQPTQARDFGDPLMSRINIKPVSCHAALIVAAFFSLPLSPAHALLPECRNMRIDADASCELRASAACDTSCDLGAMWNACAADLAAICQGGCNISADVQCTGDCGDTCEQRCRVEDVVCEDGCYDECTVLCPDMCADGDEQCIASCEATCSVDCDDKCAELSVDAKCVEHCNQCCLGMCTAQINFDCQLDCQKPDFSNCAENLVDECAISCETEGALFCDGDFVAAGNDLTDCVDALLNQKIDISEHASFKASLDSIGCSAGGTQGAAGMWPIMMGLATLLRRRRRK